MSVTPELKRKIGDVRWRYWCWASLPFFHISSIKKLHQLQRTTSPPQTANISYYYLCVCTVFLCSTFKFSGEKVICSPFVWAISVRWCCFHSHSHCCPSHLAVRRESKYKQRCHKAKCRCHPALQTHTVLMNNTLWFVFTSAFRIKELRTYCYLML